ncbi:MAG TPA: phosphatidylserine/phosphatidylglycerophosphate/cardiolipin synthase family protein [Nitrolancea sp.]|nr:phosphatidylserine/phosphatidylglycerophosphate/cardiolipin synthase family protein [Nitrolancea sp.]
MPSAFALEGLVRRYVHKATEPVLHRQRVHRLRDWKDESHPDAPAGTWWSDETHWYAGGTSPRAHNRITPLIDGGEFFPALREALEQAQQYVYIAGWFLTPYIPLGRHDFEDIQESRLLPLLVETARRVPVRILLWSGAPLLIQPSTRLTRAVQRVIEREGGGDLLCRLDSTARITHCHHQKAIVVDGQVAFVGGMDLTTYQGDRWDVAGHPLRAGVNWHDVQLRIQGEAVADVEQNFRQRWVASTGDDQLPHREPQVDPAWNTPAQIVRTIPAETYPFAPHGEFGIYHAYTTALRQAQRLIYLENQYLWSPEIVDALKEVMEQRHTDPFRIVIVLPARAYSGKWDNDDHVKKLREADGGRGIISFYSPYASGPAAGSYAFKYRAVYVHAKVAVIDDEWFTVGSANLNERGLITDSEMNVLAHDRSIACDLRLRLWAEHLGMAREELEQIDTLELIDRVWPDQAARNAKIVQRHDRQLVGELHPYQIGRMPGSWLLEEAELLTFEH